MKQLLSIFIILLLANIKCKAQNYDFKGEIRDNLALVMKNGKYGFVDNNDKLVIPCIYTSINKNFYPKEFLWNSSCVLLSACKNGKWGYIDRQGNEIISFIYDEVKSGTSSLNDILTVKKNGKYGCIDPNANVIIPFEYDDLDQIYREDQLVRAQKNNLYGFISPSNDIKVPFLYSTARTFGYKNEYKYAAVSINGKYGYIDLSGNEVIPLKYEFADDMHEGKYAAVVKNGKLGFLDIAGNEIIPFIYDPLYSTDGDGKRLQSAFVGPYIANVCKNGKWGAIKNDGTIIVPFIYDGYRSIGTEDVSFYKNGQIHYFDYGGNEYTSEKELSEKKDEILASQGYPRALYKMGLKFYNSKEYSTSLSYLIKSSAQSYKQADLYLGHHYYYGYGVDKNYQTALEYYLSAASDKVGTALYYLGWMYEHGQGVSKNLNTALNYYNEAFNGGYIKAKERILVIGGINPPNNNSLAKFTYKSEYSTTTSRYIVKVGINSSSAVTDSKVYVNGMLSRGVAPVKNDGYDFTINQEVTLKEGTNDIHVEVTNAAGTSTETYSVTYKKNKVVYRPELTWKSPLSVTSKDYALWVGVKSSATISDTKVYLNGQLSRGVVSVKNDGDDYSIKRNIVLANGENVIRVDVTNEGGTSSITKTISLSPTTPVPNPQPAPSNVVVNSQKRLALVIGNSQYTHATKLPNPANDATDISRKLRSLGFDVIEKHDLTSKDFKSAIREFGSKASLYDACLLYYAGHAIERNGKNYLIPVDAVLETQADIEDECVRVDYVIDHLEDAKSKMNIIVLDACRNNPITRSWTRSVTGGLSTMIAPSGTFIAFSTSPGRTADDGDGRNSPFTEAFLKNLDKPNLPLEMFFKEVLQDVRIKTSERQIPWSQSSFYGNFYFKLK